ncbi:hypothetical protein K4K61_005520 [Colletotrichum sp. SAR11_59]|nr:hypothetical protein K4K61_005520 [Colletotrichum sp. SAR11_59]
MDARKPSWKAWCHGLLYMLSVTMLIGTSQAHIQGGHHKRVERSSFHAAHSALFDQVSSIPAPCLGRREMQTIVLTTTISTYIELGIPCDATEIPQSMSSLLTRPPPLSIPTSLGTIATGGITFFFSKLPLLEPDFLPFYHRHPELCNQPYLGRRLLIRSCRPRYIHNRLQKHHRALEACHLDFNLDLDYEYSQPDILGGTVIVILDSQHHDRRGFKHHRGPLARNGKHTQRRGFDHFPFLQGSTHCLEWFDPPAIAPSSSSTSTTPGGPAVVIVTASAQATITQFHDSTQTVIVSPSSAPASPDVHPRLPTDSNLPGPTKRIVRFSQRIWYTENQHQIMVIATYEDNHVVTVYTAPERTDLPAVLVLDDQNGNKRGSLKMTFRMGFFTIDFRSEMAGRVVEWENHWTKDEADEDAPWCETVFLNDDGKERLAREIWCYYTA